MAETLTYHCAYCGTLQQWDGSGSAICSRCGATQPAKTLPTTSAPSKVRTVVAFVVVGALILVGISLYFVLRKARPSTATPAPIVYGTPSKTIPPVPGSRMVRVENPHIRIIPAGVEFKPEDVLETPEGTSSLTSFDPHFLSVRTPRRVLDEAGKPAYLGEVTNLSPNMVVVSPTVTLVLTRGGKTIDKATRSFGDLLPGAHVPVFFRYDGPTKTFDGMDFQWAALKAYKLGDMRHARLTASVESQTQMTADQAIGHHSPYNYRCVRVKGNVVNIGTREISNISVYVVLRDATGQITGFDHGSITLLHAGQSDSIQLTPAILGAPATSTEMVALPISPPVL